MAFTYLPYLVKIQAQFKDSEGRIDECVTWWNQNQDSPLTLTQLQTIQTAFNNAAVSSTYGPLVWIPTTCHYIGAIVSDMSSNTGLFASNAGYTPVAGTGSGTQAARQVAVLISLATTLRYRGGHGRMYLPTISSTMISTDGQTVPSGSVTNLNEWWTALQEAMAALTSPLNCQQVVLHERMQVVPHTVPPTYKPAFTTNVSTIVVQSIIATQRRRLRKVAHH
jgi:hypothetical protein